ncbi:flagellar hook assembly protein FlgD [Leeia oryzae]|uniref:flagellar hook assembly protein FlgD n=1 Tax=Leeia oryzae TaxID=356662 RepID=UPI0003680BDD|nr:flagellar hook assembly protein FlgD [Leeia oryzae]
MATVTTVDGASNPFAAFNTATSGTSVSQNQEDRFLKLLVTQLQNQDPLNPMDNSQTTSQMAQISTVSGIEKLNTTIQSLASSFAASQSFQAATLVGRNVLTAGSTLNLASGAAQGGIELGADADKVTVTVKDSFGNTVDEVDMGAQKAGVMNFTWDGTNTDGTKVADGKYTFSVKATSASKAVDATALTYGKIASATFSTSGISLSVPDVGSIALTDIKQIL